jgi:hypothetical protein
LTIEAEAGAARPVRESGDRRRRGRELAQVLALGWLARAVFIVAVPPEAHSADVDHWLVVAQQLRAHENPYVTTTYLNWPPLWLVAVWLIDHAAQALGLSFLLTLRLFLIAVESAVVVLLYSFVARFAPGEARRIVLVGISLNPLAILLVCQHGNFDVIVGLCCLAAAIALADSARSGDVVAWLAGALALGLGALAKTVPLVLGPLLVPGAAATRALAKVMALALFVGPALLGMAVIYVLAPDAVTDNVIRYRSSSGWYGLTGIADALGATRATDLYATVLFPAIAVAWFVAGSLLLRRRRLGERQVVLLAALILLAVPTLGPGYAPQYAYMWLPLLVATVPLFDRGWRRLLAVFYVVAAADYIAEYALFSSHGAFLDAFFPASGFLRDTATSFGDPSWQTVLRLPFFVASLVVLAAGARRLGQAPPRSAAEPVSA